MTITQSEWWEDLEPPDDYEPSSEGAHGYYWKSERRARTYHLCHTCRKDICPSELFQHIAIPLHVEVLEYNYCQEHYQP